MCASKALLCCALLCCAVLCFAAAAGAGGITLHSQCNVMLCCDMIWLREEEEEKGKGKGEGEGEGGGKKWCVD